MKEQPKISEYDAQAAEFLESTDTTFDIQYLYTGPYFEDDTDERDIYQFTLENGNGAYSSKFGDSIHNTEKRAFLKKGKCSYAEDYAKAKRLGIKISPSGFIIDRLRYKTMKPSAYDVLACLDAYCPDTFKDFCDDYGYQDAPLSDHDKVMRIYLSVREQAEALKRMFNSEQQDKLAEIS